MLHPPRLEPRGALPPQGRGRVCQGVILAAAIALACGVDGREPAATGPQLSEAPGEAPVASLPAAIPPEPRPPEVTVSDPEGFEATPPMPSLEDLLRLPSPVAREDVVLKPKKPDADGGAERKEDPQRIRLELKTRSDPAAVRPSTSRDRTDAGVSVGVSKTIRLRGGVRLEEESGKEREDPVPTVGIEKRF